MKQNQWLRLAMGATLLAGAWGGLSAANAQPADQGKGSPQREARRAEGEQRREQRKSNVEKRKADAENKRENNVDNREKRQDHRIDQGVKNGSLTPDELSKLQNQQKNIENLEKQYTGDGKLSHDEFKQLHDQLDVASRCIFAEKHDADGKTMSVYRLGKDVKLNPDVAQKLEDPNLPKADARAFTHDFRQMLNLKHRLASDNLSADQRTKLQEQYNELLNKYFTAIS